MEVNVSELGRVSKSSRTPEWEVVLSGSEGAWVMIELVAMQAISVVRVSVPPRSPPGRSMV